MVQENIAAQTVVKAFSLQRRTIGWFTPAQQATRAQDRGGDVPFDDGGAHRSRSRYCCCIWWCWQSARISPPTARLPIGTFVTFESAFWEMSYNIAHLMHFIPVSIQSAAAVRHMQELLDEPTRGADRPGAPELPRITNDITFDRVTLQI